MDLLIPEVGLLFWHTVSFLILLFLLTKFAWKPVMKGIKDREENIQTALDAAEKAKLEMARLTNENELLLKQAREERDAIIKEAKELKDKIVAEAKEQAQTEGAKLIETARQEIETQKQRALLELKSEVSSLSLEIARTILTKEFDDQSKQEALVADLLKGVKLN